MFRILFSLPMICGSSFAVHTEDVCRLGFLQLIFEILAASATARKHRLVFDGHHALGLAAAVITDSRENVGTVFLAIKYQKYIGHFGASLRGLSSDSRQAPDS